MSLRLCRSEKVKNPYYVSFLGVHLYSSQELAYVIYHYPLLVMDHLVDDRLLDFLREELNLGFLALKLENWRKSGEDLDEMLMFLLQESDYYSANEISEYRQTLSSYRKQPAAQIKKLRGDALFGMRQYGKAVKLYQEILDNPPEEAAEEQLTAQVWNNLGACYGRMFLFDKAAEAFEKAYNRSGSRACLRSLYWIAADMQNVELNLSLYDIFEYEELIGVWKTVNARMYVCNAAAPLNGGLMPRCAVPLLRNILESADAAIKKGTPAADLRFGHDTHLIRLLALMQIEGCSNQETDMEKFHLAWQDYRVSPMGANLQLVFYRNGKNDVLVKFLLNENEVTLPIKGGKVLYYSWEEVKTFLGKQVE